MGLPVQGRLHIDAVRAPEQLGQVLDRLPTYKILSVGLVNGRNVWRCELEQALAQLQPRRSVPVTTCGSAVPARCCTVR